MRSEFQDRPAFPNIKIARFIKDRPCKVASSKRCLRSIRRQFEDRLVVVVRHKEIARVVKDQRSGPNPSSKGGLLSLGRELKDQLVLLVRHKKIARSIEGQVITAVRH